jgi:hypothetical protein
MRMALAAATLVTACFATGFALAQETGSAPAPLDASPLSHGQAPALPPTGIPLGATELALPGTSPLSSPSGCPTDGTSSQPVTGTFDGGGMMGASSACTSGTSSSAAMPSSSSSSARSGVGIQLGSTETTSLGLSPSPPATTFVAPLASPSLFSSPPVPSAPPPMTAPPTATGPCPTSLSHFGSTAASSSFGC